MKKIRMNEQPEEGVSHNARIRKRRILQNGEAGPVTHYACAVFPPGEVAGAHCHHDLVEIFTVCAGRGEIRIDGAVHVFDTGMTVVVEPGEMHEISNTGAVELVVSYFGVLVN